MPTMPAASRPDTQVVGGVTYGTWYYTFPDSVDPYVCPYNGAFAFLPSYILPAGVVTTFYVDQCFLMIWGAQAWNGGFFSLQAQRPWDVNKTQGIVLGITHEGELKNTMHHPAPGVPIRPEDKIWIELQSKDTPADYSSLWTTEQNKKRCYSIGLWYHYTI